MHYGKKKDGSEAENVIEVDEDVADEDLSEIDKYYADRTGKYYRNCNSTFGFMNYYY
jgi:hypothetical protein